MPDLSKSGDNYVKLVIPAQMRKSRIKMKAGFVIDKIKDS